MKIYLLKKIQFEVFYYEVRPKHITKSNFSRAPFAGFVCSAILVYQ